MKVKCQVIKQLFLNQESGYRILSCIPLPPFSEGLKTNKYGSFSLSGNNLSTLNFDEYELEIEEIANSKYDASYKLVKLPMLNVEDGKIALNEQTSKSILNRIMDKSQVERVLDAYPNFIELILEGKEDKIDEKKIFNVGKKRLADYIDKIKNQYNVILFYPICYKYKIENDKDINILVNKFKTPAEFEVNIKNNPYFIFIKILNNSFDKIDSFIISNFPEFVNSKIRTEYACEYVLLDNEKTGDTKIKAGLVAQILKSLIPECKEYIVEIIKNSPRFYFDEESKYLSLYATYKAELNIANHIKDRLKSLSEPLEWKQCLKDEEIKYTDEQLQVIKNIAEGKRVVLLNGPGGTGKSFTTKAIIQMLEANRKTYTLLAPTGIASVKLSEYTGRHSSTIHMYLTQFKQSTEYFIIDELSMVSVHLLSTLLDVIGHEANLIFVCDDAQLPSIDCGNVARDLIKSNVTPCTTLTKVFRYGIGGIATVATDARHGLCDNITNDYNDLLFIDLNNAQNIQSIIINQYKKFLLDNYKKSDIMILTPMNVGEYGTYKLNAMIQEKFNTHEYTPMKRKIARFGEIQFKVGDKVLNTKNNYQARLFEFDENLNEKENEFIPLMNGEIGFIKEYREKDGEKQLIIDFNNKLIIFGNNEINHLLLGYVITIHKIQGNSSKAVIVLIHPTQKKMLNRNLLYVAFSRAQKNMSIVSDINSLKDALKIQEEQNRNTWLYELLKDKKEGD